MRTEKKVLIWVGASLGVFVIIVVAAVIYFILSLSRPGEATARYIPSGAPLYVSVNLRPGAGQLKKGRDVIEKVQTEELIERRDKALDELEENTGIHFLDDVTPWLGTDVSVAILDVVDGVTEWVAMVRISDREAAIDFVDDLVSHLEDELRTDFDKDDRGGLDLWVASDEPVAMAITDEYMLIGDSGDTVADIAGYIESPPSLSLMDNESFVAARQMVPEQRVMFAFAQFDDLIDAYLDVLDLFQGMDSVMRQIEDEIPEFAVASASFVDNGLRLDVAYVPPDGSVRFDESEGSRSPDALPADTLVMVVDAGLVDAWNELRELIEEADAGVADEFDNVLEQVEAEFGIDVQRDVIDALTGEIAIALLPSEVGSPFSLETGLSWTIEALLIAGVKDRDSIEGALDKLVDRLDEVDGIDARREQLGEYEVVTFDLDLGGFLPLGYDGGYLVTDEWLAAGTTSDSLKSFHRTLTGESGSLGGGDEFRRLMDAAPSPTHFLLYADLAGVMEMVEDALSGEARSSYREDIEPFVENLSAFMVASSITEEEARFTVVLTVQGE